MTYTQPPVPPRQPGAASALVPQSIKNAVWAMYAGAALSALTMIVGLVTKNQVLDDLRARLVERGDSIVEVNQTVNDASSLLTPTIIVQGIIAVLLWIWMAMANGKGRKWARIVATVLFVINTIGTIYSFFSSPRPHGISLVLNVLTWLAGLAAIYYLYRPESTEFFNRADAVR